MYTSRERGVALVTNGLHCGITVIYGEKVQCSATSNFSGI